jgi:hypothetical protein
MVMPTSSVVMAMIQLSGSIVRLLSEGLWDMVLYRGGVW